VELLEDIEEFSCRCVNGKLRLTGYQACVTKTMVQEVSGKVKVGLHRDAQVVFKRGPNPRILQVLPTPPVVDQVLSASANWRNPGIADGSLRELTRALLRASYEGAYLAAILREREVLLLTLVGGASFGNPMGLILEELVRAHDRWASHSKSRLREVKLVLYEPDVATEFRERLEQARHRVQQQSEAEDVTEDEDSGSQTTRSGRSARGGGAASREAESPWCRILLGGVIALTCAAIWARLRSCRRL